MTIYNFTICTNVKGLKPISFNIKRLRLLNQHVTSDLLMRVMAATFFRHLRFHQLLFALLVNRMEKLLFPHRKAFFLSSHIMHSRGDFLGEIFHYQIAPRHVMDSSFDRVFLPSSYLGRVFPYELFYVTCSIPLMLLMLFYLVDCIKLHEIS
jgi:hypothetical protein